MTSDRPYRKGMPAAAAFAEIEKQSGKQFDPEFAAGFLEIKHKIVEELASQATQLNTTRRTRAIAL